MRRTRLAALLALPAAVSCMEGGGGDRAASANLATPAARAAVYGTSSAEAKQLAALVDEYLDGWAALYPSIAAGNGSAWGDAHQPPWPN